MSAHHDPRKEEIELEKLALETKKLKVETSLVTRWLKIFSVLGAVGGAAYGIYVGLQEFEASRTESQRQREAKERRLIEENFLRLDLRDLREVRRGVIGLGLYVNHPDFADLVHQELRLYLSSLRPPHDLKPKASEPFADKDELEKEAKSQENLYMMLVLGLIRQFNEKEKEILYTDILNNRALIYGRFLAADILDGKEKKGNYWQTLIADPDLYFRDIAVREIKNRDEEYVDDILIGALNTPDIRFWAIVGLEDRQSKKAAPHLVDILKNVQDQSDRYYAYRALKAIDPSAAEQFEPPPKPRYSWETDDN